MKPNWTSRALRVGLLLIAISTLTACVWWRLYQTKMQIEEFDRYFSVEVTNQFILHFKEPVIYREDIDYLSKLYPSSCTLKEVSRYCLYRFYKVNEEKRIIPVVQFFFEFNYNDKDRLSALVFSPIFLHIASAEFLEISLRSLGEAKINSTKYQLQANANTIKKISARLPKQSEVLAQLGEPLKISEKPGIEVYTYRFLLNTPRIEPGYEERAMSVIWLSFDSKSDELVMLKGSFAGFQISIDYRKLIEKSKEAMVDFNISNRETCSFFSSCKS